MPLDLSYLKMSYLFSGLAEDQLTKIAAIIIDRQYPKGRIIFTEGEPGEAIYLLKSGLIKLTKHLEDGREHILHFVHPGEIFAEVVIFNGGDFPATAEVQEDALVGVIRNRDIEDLIQVNPRVAVELLRIMSRRLRAAQDKLMNLALHDTLRRLAFTLLKMAEENGVPDKRGLVLNLNLTNQELANLIGTTRETVNRILNGFKRDNIIKVDRQQLILLNQKKLEDLLT